jgi:hypothetical protein
MGEKYENFRMFKKRSAPKRRQIDDDNEDIPLEISRKPAFHQPHASKLHETASIDLNLLESDSDSLDEASIDLDQPSKHHQKTTKALETTLTLIETERARLLTLHARAAEATALRQALATTMAAMKLVDLATTFKHNILELEKVVMEISARIDDRGLSIAVLQKLAAFKAAVR